MTGLPRTVRDQEERANELHRQHYGQPEDEQGNPEDQPEQEEQATEAETQPEPETTAAPQGKGADYWEQRFNVLQGKYNAEIRQLSDTNRELKERNTRNDSRLAELEKSLKEQRRNQPVDLSERFSPEQIEEFGADTLQLVHQTARSMAEEISEEKATQIRQELQGDFEQVRQTQAQTQTENFWGSLATSVPDWEQINDDPGFHSWLAESVPVHTDQGVQKRTRQSLLEGYQQAGNARGVAEFFQSFKQTSKGEHKDTRANREVPPRTTGGSAQQVAPKGEVWVTQDDIKNFYDPRNKAAWKRDPEGMRARETEIEDAVAAGRVR